jgi:hypothetical protein
MARRRDRARRAARRARNETRRAELLNPTIPVRPARLRFEAWCRRGDAMHLRWDFVGPHFTVDPDHPVADLTARLGARNDRNPALH